MKKLILIPILLLLLPYLTQAQHEFYNNGDSVVVQPGALLYVEGQLENYQNSAAFINNGIIELRGDFTNGSGADAPKFYTTVAYGTTGVESAVKFIGDKAGAAVTQNIIAGAASKMSGAINDKSFYNLIIDQSNAASKVVMQTDATVQGSLVFDSKTTGSRTFNDASAANVTNNASSNGRILTYNGTNDYDLFVANGYPNAVVGYATPVMGNSAASTATESYIENRGAQGVGVGGFSREVDLTGTDYYYPVATAANTYNPLRFNFSAVSGSADVQDNKIRGMFVDGNTGTIGQTCRITTTGDCVPDNTGYNRYFTSNPYNGGAPQWLILNSFPSDHGYWSFNGNAGNTYVIEAFPNSFTLTGGSADNKRLLKYSAAIGAIPNGDWNSNIEASIATSNDLLQYTRGLGNNTFSGIPGGSYSGFSHFELASNNSNALPIELIYLKADAVENKFIHVSWATATEINNKGFDVMRKAENENEFTKVGWVDGNNNSTTTIQYGFDDKNVTANMNYYYKLVQRDNDGKSKETYMVSARIQDGDMFSISDFIPNPTNNSTKLIINTPSEEKVKVKFYDLLGNVVIDEEFNLTAGTNTVNFNGSTLASATYTAIINAHGGTFTKRLVISKS